MSPEDRFVTFLEAFRREGHKFTMFTTVYRYLHERRHDSLDALNVAPAFFQTVLVALREVIIITAHKMVVGDRGGELSLKSFLTFVGSNLGLFSTEAYRTRQGFPANAWQVQRHEAPTLATVRADRRRLSTLGAVSSLRLLRNKYHAHFDPDFFVDPDRLGEAAPLRWQDLTDIRSTVEEILNRYSAAFNGNVFAFQSMNARDAEYVIDALRMWRQRP